MHTPSPVAIAIQVGLIATPLFLAWRIVVRKETWAVRVLEAYLIVNLGLILMSLMLPAVQAARWLPPSQHRCLSNLERIGTALRQYHAAYGSFPPAFIADENGRPERSWRRLILPCLHEQNWQPPENGYPDEDSQTSSQSRDDQLYALYFCCPKTCYATGCRVSYFAVIGPETAWPGNRPARIPDDFPDGADKTILVIEMSGVDSRWMEPSDVAFDKLSFRLNDLPGRSLSAGHKKVNVLFADGHAASLPVDTPAETIRALLTANGGEAIENALKEK